MQIDDIILANLIHNEAYGRKVLPHLVEEYFHSKSDKIVFNLAKTYIDKYNKFPSKEALIIELQAKDGLDESIFKETQEKLATYPSSTAHDAEWLHDKTEEFCQNQACHNGVLEVIQILDGTSKLGRGAMIEIMQKALSVSFNTDIGHDYFEDFDKRWEYYTRKEARVRTGLEYLDKVMNGGPPPKTLNVIMAPTGVGKSLVMSHLASTALMDGKNVLYITLELSKEEVSKRMDANLLNIPISDIEKMPKEKVERKLKSVKEKTVGKYIVQEYPATSCTAHTIRHLLQELKLKKKFVPDVVFLDYLNLCSSSRVKMGGTVNSYNLIKAVAEEIRGIAQEFGFPIWTATQTNRSGWENSDIGMENTSESFGLPMTADFMIGAMQPPDFKAQGLYLFKQLKNRYGDPNRYEKFVVGVDKPFMRLFDASEESQNKIAPNVELDNSFSNVDDRDDDNANAFSGWK